jgi:putative ABC transport system ATP-binding protein
MNNIAISTQELTKAHTREEFAVTALDGIILSIPQGALVALMGPSGSGKSTPLHLVAAMDMPTAGEIKALGSRLEFMKDRELACWRNTHIRFLFQFFNLIPVLTALENVELPLNRHTAGREPRRI